jgi:hypothetical protein
MIRMKDKNRYPLKAICDICGDYIISFGGFHADGNLLKKSFQHEDIKHVCKKCGVDIDKCKNDAQRKMFTGGKWEAVVSAVKNQIDYMIYLNNKKEIR